MLNFFIASGKIEELPEGTEQGLNLIVSEDCVAPVWLLANRSIASVQSVDALNLVPLSAMILNAAEKANDREILVNTNNAEIAAAFKKLRFSLEGRAFSVDSRLLAKTAKKSRGMAGEEKPRQRKRAIKGNANNSIEPENAGTNHQHDDDFRYKKLENLGIRTDAWEAVLRAVDRATDAEIGLPTVLKLELSVSELTDEFDDILPIVKNNYKQLKARKEEA